MINHAIDVTEIKFQDGSKFHESTFWAHLVSLLCCVCVCLFSVCTLWKIWY